MKIKAGLLIGSVLLAGCVTRFEQPSETDRSAIAIFEKGYERGLGFGAATGQTYSHIPSEDISCRKSLPRIAYFTWTSGKEQSRRIPVGEPFIVTAATVDYRSDGYATVSDESCINWARFTPEDGSTYRIKQAAREGYDCALEITDIATGLPPEDLLQYEEPPCVWKSSK